MFGLPISGNLKGIVALKEKSWGETIKSGTCPEKGGGGGFKTVYLEVDRGQK